MSDERRLGKRAPISGVRVTYESAAGERVEADVLDLATGGIFIRAADPLAVGKRLALELHILGETGASSALGRVVWARRNAEPGRPAGMGVKLIDVDDATVELIERLVETREPTAPGIGNHGDVAGGVGAAPVVAIDGAERERTLMGVGGSEPPPAAATADGPAPTVERPVDPPSGSVALDLVPARERSVAFDLVAARAPVDASTEPSVATDLVAANEPTGREAPRARRSMPSAADAGPSSARWVVIGLLLVIAGIAAYVLFDGFLRPLGR